VPFFEWSDKYLVNIPAIDADHRNLFALANSIHEHVENGAGHGAVLQALGQLLSYVYKHFDREERLMEKVAYPDIAGHKKTHRMLEQIVQSMHRIYMTDPDAVDPQKVLEFLRDWLQGHIIKSDMQYEPWINNRLQQTSGEVAWSETLNPVSSDEISVEVAVPTSKAWIIHACARIIRNDDWRAEVIEEAATRATDEQLAKDKTIAAAVLR